jgi:hypothetical protein
MSENYGPEQEHLNNVAGARLRITALRPPSGPKIELLQYLAPQDSERYPSDAKANDLLHWETSVSVADAQKAFETAHNTGLEVGSNQPGEYVPARTEFLLSDPDGHQLALRSTHKSHSTK